jgi:urease accessory protein
MNFRILFALLLLPSFAHAHPGHGGGDFGVGFSHPFLGWDHMLAMLAVGLWAAQRGGSSIWALPLSFVASMGLSLAVGATGVSLPWIEASILLSVLILGALIATKLRMPAITAVALTGGSAFFHGLAHAPEIVGGHGMPFAAGLLVATALLHFAGLLAGIALIASGRNRWLQLTGATVCATVIGWTVL